MRPVAARPRVSLTSAHGCVPESTQTDAARGRVILCTDAWLSACLLKGSLQDAESFQLQPAVSTSRLLPTSTPASPPSRKRQRPSDEPEAVAGSPLEVRDEGSPAKAQSPLRHKRPHGLHGSPTLAKARRLFGAVHAGAGAGAGAGSTRALSSQSDDGSGSMASGNHGEAAATSGSGRGSGSGSGSLSTNTNGNDNSGPSIAASRPSAWVCSPPAWVGRWCCVVRVFHRTTACLVACCSARRSSANALP